MTVRTKSVFRSQSEAQGIKRIEDPLEAHRYVGRAIETAAKVEVSLPGTSIRFSSEIDERSDLRKGLKISVPEMPVPLEPSAPVPGGVMVIAFLRGQVLLCIQSEQAEHRDGALLIPPPWNVFKLQRRKEPRFEIPAAYELMVSMDAQRGSSGEGGGKRVKRLILDLSPSGMAFLVPPSSRDALVFKRGLFIRRLELQIENRQIFLDARISGVYRLKNNPHRIGFKVGVEFMRIGPMDSRFIAAYVARNLAQMYL